MPDILSVKEYAKVIVDIAYDKLDRPFSYRVPDYLKQIVSIGTCVKVPFGKGNTLRQGYIIDFTDDPGFDKSKIKDITEVVLSNLPIESRYIELAGWMRNRYGATMISALKTVIPAHKKSKRLVHKYVSLKIPQREVSEYLIECQVKKRVAQRRLLEELILRKGERIPYELVTHKLNISASALRSLKEKCIIEITEEEYYRNPVNIDVQNTDKLNLSDEQQYVVRQVFEEYSNGNFKPVLLHGITGSGKTEVYIRLIEENIKRGKQAIVLIPEIALTLQTLMRFYKNFGDRVSVVNSSLSKGEKEDQFERARNGEIDVIIGPRSALFTPFQKIGLIIIDEEHELSYKSEQTPKYHAREVAIKLAMLQDEPAIVVLGSATPSIDSYYNAQTGKYQLMKLTRRLTGGKLPEVECADLREELRSGNRSVFSRRLQELIENRLEKKEQIILFINRRGLAGFVSCRSCGYVFKCPHCDVSLSEHRGGKLVCHYCGYSEDVRRICPECGSKYVSAFRAGTEQIVKEVNKMWPKARVLRMDADTTRTKGSYEKILSSFANEEADILVGTQMIVKGHDFPNVTLVGVLAADMSLYANDYRASERTFQLLTQAAGRAGRGTKEGNVVIQTYQVEHYAIRCACRQDYESFYEKEIEYRKLLNYPPVSHMMAVQISSTDETKGISFANRIRAIIETNQMLRKKAEVAKNEIIIGPTTASISKINDIFRFVIYVKHEDYGILTEDRYKIEEFIDNLTKSGQYRGFFVQFDFDPVQGF
ncbi:replication restart helicase PriA [Butyrivibrio sp. NC3005]|uniref:replication restart helicase PriA n=1 Tax=Butyrivibrio sp. NC3005 TaxID=1280685 RepID=UPI000400A593|nr:primosomal protein N' [Butyrivibrio sp. NC3005]